MIMKKLAILLVVLFVGFSAYAQTVRSTSNHRLANVDQDGTFRDECNKFVFRICSDGSVRDNSNRMLGKVDTDGRVSDPCNNYLGKVCGDGTVRDDCNHMVGRVEDDGRVRDPQNHTLGYAKGVPKTWAALFFFIKL